MNAVKPGDANVAPDAWMAGIESAEFKALVDAKQRAIMPMVVIYIVGYLGLSILAGFGRTLLDHATREARRRGAKRLTILADPYAAAFYERMGARRVGEAPSDVIPGRLVPFYEIALV